MNFLAIFQFHIWLIIIIIKYYTKNNNTNIFNLAINEKNQKNKYKL